MHAPLQINAWRGGTPPVDDDGIEEAIEESVDDELSTSAHIPQTLLAPQRGSQTLLHRAAPTRPVNACASVFPRAYASAATP